MAARPGWRVALVLLTIGVGFVVLVLIVSLVVSPLAGVGGPRVALVTVEGVIADPREVLDQLERFRESSAVKALVVRINSPGGAVAPSQEITEELKRFKASGRPVVASMASVAASGGYYIATAADRIVANPGTITGSIGVIMQIPNVAGLLQKVGVKTTVIKAGEHKDLASPLRDLTDAERQILQGVLDDVHQQFIEAVATSRRLDRGRVEALADGRIFSGRQALSLGLVDELGDLPDALDRAAKLANLPGKPRVLQERRRRFSLWDLLTRLGWDVAAPARRVPSLDYLMYW